MKKKKVMEKKIMCIICSDSFKPKNSLHLYCSNECEKYGNQLRSRKYRVNNEKKCVISTIKSKGVSIW